MDLTLIQKLSEYCDQLVGETTHSNPTETKKTRKRNKTVEEDELCIKSNGTEVAISNGIKKKKKCKRKHREEVRDNSEQHEDNDCRITENQDLLVSSNIKDTKADISDDHKVLSEVTKVSLDDTPNNTLVTDDGFKIVSSIPEDDSDVSDAFESDIGEEEDLSPRKKELLKVNEGASTKVKTTEDGFKIISEIPPDDSDISDAFDDQEECDGPGKELVTQKKQLGSARNLSKPILQMMDDFGLGEDIFQKKKSEINNTKRSKKKKKVRNTIYAVKNSKKRKKKKSEGPLNTTTLAAQRKPRVDVTVYDYSKKPQPKKKTASNPRKVNGQSLTNTKEKLEKEMKQMRFEIFKLGVSGFEKEKRKESRVALAIKLGAKPPKKEHVSYKELLTTKKNEKIQKQKEQEMKKEMGIKDKKKFKPDSKTKKKPRAFTAQLGRYKDGVQFLSKKDIAKINRS